MSEDWKQWLIEAANEGDERVSEQRYTLAEAKAIIRLRECRRNGHQWVDVRTLSGQVVVMHCESCGATAEVTEPEVGA